MSVIVGSSGQQPVAKSRGQKPRKTKQDKQQ